MWYILLILVSPVNSSSRFINISLLSEIIVIIKVLFSYLLYSYL